MSEGAKHTPGPWFWTTTPYSYQGSPEERQVSVYYRSPGYYDNLYLAGATGPVVGCDEYNVFDGDSPEQRIANMRLLAAAPEMLAALGQVGALLEVARRLDELTDQLPRIYQETEEQMKRTQNVLAKVEGAVSAAIAKAEGRAE